MGIDGPTGGGDEPDRDPDREPERGRGRPEGEGGQAADRPQGETRSRSELAAELDDGQDDADSGRDHSEEEPDSSGPDAGEHQPDGFPAGPEGDSEDDPVEYADVRDDPRDDGDHDATDTPESGRTEDDTADTATDIEAEEAGQDRVTPDGASHDEGDQPGDRDQSDDPELETPGARDADAPGDVDQGNELVPADHDDNAEAEQPEPDRAPEAGADHAATGVEAESLEGQRTAPEAAGHEEDVQPDGRDQGERTVERGADTAPADQPADEDGQRLPPDGSEPAEDTEDTEVRGETTHQEAVEGTHDAPRDAAHADDNDAIDPEGQADDLPTGDQLSNMDSDRRSRGEGLLTSILERGDDAVDSLEKSVDLGLDFLRTPTGHTQTRAVDRTVANTREGLDHPGNSPEAAGLVLGVTIAGIIHLVRENVARRREEAE